jgi:hypothetical protein
LSVWAERGRAAFENVCCPVAEGRAREHLHSEKVRPDIRPQLREFLAWYEEVLGGSRQGRWWRQENKSGSRKRRQPCLTFLDLLDSSADEPAS